jgi:hypothetical protein
MNQSTVNTAAIVFAFVFFTTLKGNLHKYLQVLGLQ